MTDSLADERGEAHAELAKERWASHRDQHFGEKELATQKWEAHDDAHTAIANSLKEYKQTANEWRGSLSDLRATFISRAEVEGMFNSAGVARDSLADKIDALDKRLDSEREERLSQQNLRSGAVDTWKWITGFLGFGGIGAIVWALLNASPK